MSATRQEGGASAPPSPRPSPLPGGIVGALNEAFFGKPAPIAPYTPRPRYVVPRGTALLRTSRIAIEVTARLCIVVLLLVATAALSIRAIDWALS